MEGLTNIKIRANETSISNSKSEFDFSNLSLTNIDLVKIRDFLFKDQKRACKTINF